jgi:hypothetical protein
VGVSGGRVQVSPLIPSGVGSYQPVEREQRADGRELGQTNQCLYCLTQALRIDPSDVDALWEVANIHRAQGSGYKVCPQYEMRD